MVQNVLYVWCMVDTIIEGRRRPGRHREREKRDNRSIKNNRDERRIKVRDLPLPLSVIPPQERVMSFSLTFYSAARRVQTTPAPTV